MLLLCLLLLNVQDPERETVFSWLDLLVGQDWVAEFPDGKMVDHQHFEWQFERKFLRSRHTVSKPDGQILYSGEALFSWDERRGCLAWWYWNSTGGVIVGSTRIEDGKIVFTGSPQGVQNGSEVLGDWVIEAGKWTCTQYFLREGRWEKAFSLQFKPKAAD